MEQTKTCSKCGEVKPVSDFGIDRREKSGLHTRCKDCVNTASRDRYASNEDVRKKKKEYRDSTKEKTKQYNALYKKNNPEKIKSLASKYKKSQSGKACAKRYREKNRDLLSAKSLIYHAANREKEMNYKLDYYKRNPELKRCQKARSISLALDGYIRERLTRDKRINTGEITKELIELKRKQLLTHRLSKKLKQLRKEQDNAE